MRAVRLACQILMVGMCGLMGAGAVAGDWPQFRGPDGQGHAETSGLPLEWSEKQNVAWKTEIPGKGWSSPVIEGDQIWMTTSLTEDVSEAERKKLQEKVTNSQPVSIVGRLSLRAVCVDRKSGKLRADVELISLKYPQPTHTLNSFASPTPVIRDGRLYCHFGTYGTACLDTASGKVVWTNRDLQIEHQNGPGSTPVLWKNLLIFHCDGIDEQYIVALDVKTGKVVWKTDRSGELRDNVEMKKAYGTPLVVEISGRPQLISPAADWLYSYDPETGEELWKLNYGVLGFSNVPRPIIGHGMIYICTSFVKSQLLAIRYDDLQEGETPRITWRYTQQVPAMSSPLLVGDAIYFVSDQGGIATCLDAHSGELLWRNRLGGNFAASPLAVDGRVMFFSREGETTVIKPGAKFRKLATNQLDGTHMASPAAVDGALFLRTESALYRIESTP